MVLLKVRFYLFGTEQSESGSMTPAQSSEPGGWTEIHKMVQLSPVLTGDISAVSSMCL